MNLLNRRPPRLASAGLLVLALVLTLGDTARTSQPALAITRLQKLNQPQSQHLAQQNRLSFRVGIRPSRYRWSAFSRSGECIKDQDKLTVIAPRLTDEEQEVIEQDDLREGDAGIDKTISSHPMVFAYIPQTVDRLTAELTLQEEVKIGENEKGEALYYYDQIHSQTFELTNRSGIVGIQIPNSAPALEQDKNYTWQLGIICNPDNRSTDVTVDSWITRIDTSIAFPTDPQEKAFELANEGIWQDAVSTLALLRYSNVSSASLDTDWSDLLISAGLPEFASAPIVQIVQ